MNKSFDTNGREIQLDLTKLESVCQIAQTLAGYQIESDYRTIQEHIFQAYHPDTDREKSYCELSHAKTRAEYIENAVRKYAIAVRTLFYVHEAIVRNGQNLITVGDNNKEDEQ